jgi:hypothetical protein
MHFSALLLCALLALAKPAAPKSPPMPDREVLVEAGDLDRQDSIVWLELTTEDSLKRWRLLDAQGRAVPFQSGPRARAAFVLKSLAAKKTATFRLVEDRKPAPMVGPPSRVRVDSSNPTVLRVLHDGKPVLDFQGQFPRGTAVPPKFLRSGYINPVFTPSGAPVTEAMPKDEPRHLGIWSFWRQFQTRNQMVNFWEKVGESGTIQMESMGPPMEGPVFSGFEARFIATGIQLGGATVVRDQWHVMVYAGPAGKPRYFMFEIESEQAITDQAVSIAKGETGGIFVRGRAAWKQGPSGLLRVTSDPLPDAQRVLWAYLGGTENGKTAGIAMLGHPSNFGSPQYLGKFAGAPLLNLSPTRDQAVPIDPYRPLRQTYRFVALDGPFDRKLLSRLSNDFAFPPRATLRELTATGKRAP